MMVLSVCVMLLQLPVCQAEEPLTDSFFVTDVNGQCEDYILSTVLFHGDLYMLSNQKLYRYSLTSREKDGRGLERDPVGTEPWAKPG